jgi:hypothetical protein
LVTNVFDQAIQLLSQLLKFDGYKMVLGDHGEHPRRLRRCYFIQYLFRREHVGTIELLLWTPYTFSGAWKSAEYPDLE